MKNRAIIVSGYFNPLHIGHIEYFKIAKKNFDKLFVIVNNDYQRHLKGSNEFMLEDERVEIIKALSITDKVYLSIDRDRSVSKTIEHLYNIHKSEYKLFWKWRRSVVRKCSRKELCNSLGIELIDGLGEKIQSSSWLIKKNQ